MFSIEKVSINIIKIKENTLSEFGFEEIEGLSELITNNFMYLSNTRKDQLLLIIQKEIDSFNDTRKCLDIFLINIKGDFVIIKNKFDDTFRDVVRRSYAA